MDGFHLTRAQLDALPDPANAHARRGAEFTFDGDGFLKLVQRLRAPLTPSSSVVYAPSFDHAVKDPKEDDIVVDVSHKIVVFEGNCTISGDFLVNLESWPYEIDVLLDKTPWSTAAALMDLRWFVQVDPAVARIRLARRHVAAGIVANLEEGDRRALENDLPNGEEVVRHLVPEVDEIVTSLEDGRWVHP
jgi:pantothenate kinase